MTARNKPASKQSHRSSKEAAKPQARERTLPMRIVVRLFGDTKRALITAGTLAGAIVALHSAAGLLLPEASKPPPTVEAGFEEAKVEPNVPLLRYNYESSSASGSADDGFPTRAGDFPISDDNASGAALGGRVAVSEGPIVMSAAVGEENEARTKENELAAARIARENAKAAEEVAKKQKEDEREYREAKEARERQRSAEEKERVAGPSGKRAGGAHETPQAGTPPSSTTPVPREGNAVGGGHGNQQAGKQLSPTPFHREGNAEVLIGTGVPTREVDAVLGKAEVILRESDAGFSKEGTGFSEGDSFFREISTGEASGSATGAGPQLPRDCPSECPLAPAVNKAIDESYSLPEAAKKVAAMIQDSRVQAFEGNHEPVGVTVYYRLDFVGFAGKLMILKWTLHSGPTGRPLEKAWWQNVTAKQFKPFYNTYKTSGNFWAPIPTAQGDYFFRLQVFEGGSEPAERETEKFH